MLVFPAWVLAQPLPYTPGQRAAIQHLSRDIRTDREKLFQRVNELARLRNLPLRTVRSDGTVVILQSLDERGNPIFEATQSATRAGQATRTASLYAGGGLGVALTGGSPAMKDKLGIWDGGRVLASHTEFGGRVTQVDDPFGSDTHATHVSGIMMGAGQNPLAQGMAFGASLRAWDFGNDEAEMAAAAADLLVSNHSYSTVAGWQFNADRQGDVKWEWYGDTTVSATEDIKFGLYNAKAREWDRIAYNAPYYLIVNSAGNNQNRNGPGDGLPHYLISRRAISRETRKTQAGYDQIPTYATAKNILTVGATAPLTEGYVRPSDVALANFSSWGPTDDGRIKPDLVGVGVGVLSASATGNASYVALGGTSMSAPNVSGSLFLLQEYHAQLNGGRFMRSATLKGLAIHTASETGDAPGPDYRFGWGILNTERAARVLANSDRSHLVDERSLKQGDTYTLPLVASGRGPLVVTLCWTDPEGAVTPSNAEGLNNPTPKLVNDLDIRISDGSGAVLPWVLDPAAPAQPATRGDNIRDNVEQIRIDNPIPGRTYALTVSHKGTLRNNQQEFSLLVSGAGGKAYCHSAATSPERSRIDRVRFGTIDQAGREGCQTFTDFTGNSTVLTAGQLLPLEVQLGTCGETRPAIVRVFIDWNSDGDFEDADETVATSTALAVPATFRTDVRVPGGRLGGQSTRMRIITSETTDAATVLPCGGYANGETQDFVLRFTASANDVGVVGLLSPENGFCGRTETQVTIRLRNFGTVAQRSIPVQAQVLKTDGTLVASLTGVAEGLGASADGQLTLRSSEVLEAGQIYRIRVQTMLEADQDITNDAFSDTRTTAGDPVQPTRLAATFCEGTPVSLRNSGSGTAFWYDAPTGGNMLASGNQSQTPQRPPDDVFYVSLNDFAGVIGPADKRAFGGGSYAGNFGPQPLIRTRVPLVLESARLYIGTAGRIAFTVRKLDDSPISSVLLNVTPTRNPDTPQGNAPSGQQSDDPDDPGREYALNLNIPEPGDYKITIDYDGGASIFRSNVGVTSFPYTLADVLTLRGALFRRSDTQVDTLTNAYYYFYNLKVRSLGCQAPERIPVKAQRTEAVQATITPNAPTEICEGSSVLLRTTEGANLSYRWLRNGEVINNAASATFQADRAGSYVVQIVGGCQPVSSSAVPILIRERRVPAISRDGYLLTSSKSTGNQWLLNGIPITGATQPTLTATQSGRYAVRTNEGPCGELLSPEVLIELVTATGPSLLSLHVSPNPADESIRITFAPDASPADAYVLQIINAQGAVARRVELKAVNRQPQIAFVELAGLAAGLYVVVVEDNRQRRIGQGKLLKR